MASDTFLHASGVARGHSVIGWSIVVVLTAVVGAGLGWLVAEVVTAVAT